MLQGVVLLPVVVLQFHHARGRKFGPIPDYAALGRGTRDKPVRVAIVGGGASGIAAAWHLRHSREAQEGKVTFTLLEKNDYLGGHAFSAPYTYKDDGSGDAETGTTHRFDMGFIFGASGGYDQFRAWAALYGVERQVGRVSVSSRTEAAWPVERSPNAPEH